MPNQWNLLRQWDNTITNPWMVIGDMNLTMYDKERHSQTRGSNSMTNWIRHIVRQMALIDLGYIGDPYTWSNHRQEPHLVMCRLDRAFVNNQWISKHGNSRLFHLIDHGSDHRPIMLKTDLEAYNKHKQFRFQNGWLKESSCKPLIKESWSQPARGSPAYQLAAKQNRLRNDLKIWNRQNFGNMDRNIIDIEHRLVDLSGMNRSNHQQVHDLHVELQKWLDRKRDYWIQHSRDERLRDTDTNTKYFHSMANYRKKINNIDSLRGVNGSWILGKEQLQHLLTSHFAKIARTTNPNLIKSNIFNLLPKVITEGDNIELLRIPTLEEIKDVTYSMKP
ncbi:hypothetical protein MKX01_004369 [Papaver californicum]|nr:hypothetical protein MKX01_004369 [Papaver californicum]